MLWNLAESAKLVEALKPQAGAALTGDYICCKHAARVWVVVHLNQAAVNSVAITIEQASAVVGTSSKPITVNVPIWANEDCAASDTLVAIGPGVGFATSAAQKDKLVVFSIDPSTLDAANGFDCLTVKTAASNAGNITSAFYLLTDLRYESSTPPSAIID